MTKDEALKLALEALEDLGMKHFESTGEVLYKETFTAIKEALAQPEQLREENERLHVENRRLIDRIETIGVPVGVGGFATTTTAQRTWVGLTDEEIKQMGLSNYIKIVRETEAKLKEKNT